MKNTLNSGARQPKFINWKMILVSILLAITFSLFVYAYWLSDIFPPLSKRSFGVSALFFAADTLINYLVLTRIIRPTLTNLPNSIRLKGISIALILSASLFWFGLEGQMPESRFLTFLLPRQTLEINVPQNQPENFSTASITWLKTSVAEVSFNSFHREGWERIGDELVLTDLDNNALLWNGPTGSETTLVFKTSPKSGDLIVSWNGNTKTVELFSEDEGELIFNTPMRVPFYASREMLIIFGLLNSTFFLCVLGLLLWNSREMFSDELAGLSPASSLHAYTKKDLYAILALLAAAFMLRVFNLENLFPFADEYSHLLAAKNLISGAGIGEVYQRGLFIVTLPVALSFKVFGAHLWAARLTGVIVNSLAILPLYLILRKINRPIAIIGGMLYALSPWIIAVSRNVREYGYYPFYFYWIIYLMIRLIEAIPAKLVLHRDWKKLIKPAIIFQAMLLILPIIYSKYVDPSSTFRSVLAAYLVLLVFLAAKVDWNRRENIWVIGLILAALAAGYRLFFKSLTPSPNLTANISALMGYFFHNSPTQWFYEKNTTILGLIIAAGVILSFYYRPRAFHAIFLIAVFLFSSIFFTLKFNHYFRPRYFFNLQIWYIFPIAIGTFIVWLVLRSLLKLVFNCFTNKPKLAKTLGGTLAALLLMLNLNFQQTMLPTFYKDNGFMPITTEYHYDLKEVHAIVSAQASNSDILVYTLYGSYAKWLGYPHFSSSHYYNYRQKDGQAAIHRLIKNSPSGWIVLDKWHGQIYSQPLPFESFTLGEISVEYLGLFKDEHIWRWQ